MSNIQIRRTIGLASPEQKRKRRLRVHGLIIRWKLMKLEVVLDDNCKEQATRKSPTVVMAIGAEYYKPVTANVVVSCRL